MVDGIELLDRGTVTESCVSCDSHAGNCTNAYHKLVGSDVGLIVLIITCTPSRMRVMQLPLDKQSRTYLHSGQYWC